MFKEIILAIQSYIQAHKFIVKHKLWKWILIPGVLYAILFSFGIYVFWTSSSYAIDFFLTISGLKKWLSAIDTGLIKFLFIFGQVILQLLLMMFYFSLFKFLFLIIGSPLFAYLSEKTESIIENRDYPFSFSQLIKDMGRGVSIALRNTVWQSVYSISILLLCLIPFFGWFTPPIALIIECYYFGFSMLDYSCERHKLSPAESISFIGRHKGLAVGNGMIFFAMHSVLFVGWILAPSYAVVAATLSLYKVEKN